MNASEEHVLFYHEIGVAITQWSHVERAILEIAGACAADTDFNALAHGYFSIENFRSKLAFANSLVITSKAEASAIDEWNDLFRRIESSAKVRNKLAHFCVVVYPTNTAGRRYALQARISKVAIEPTKHPKPPSGALCLLDIVTARYSFHALTMSLENFASRLRGMAEQYPKSGEAPMKPPTLQMLQKQLKELVGV